jgi:endonuclease/exonuclease/phosphatase family metal-dependent hydrolase
MAFVIPPSPPKLAPLLVRTWNVFHGNAKPPERRAFLEETVRLAAADRPDVLCLQEVPVWALGRLGEWSGMTAVGAVAARPTIGPLPSTAELGRKLTSLDEGRLRSAFSGQANAVLVAAPLRVLDTHTIVLNPRRFRRAQARWLGLDLVARLAWAKERRVCQGVRVRAEDGATTLVGNLHATSYPADRRLADAELLRAAWFVGALAAPEEPVVLCGDFNVEGERSRTLRDLAGPEWGFSAAGEGIDHVVVRGAAVGRVVRWPPERRRLDGRLLSDHAPVEVRVG